MGRADFHQQRAAQASAEAQRLLARQASLCQLADLGRR